MQLRPLPRSSSSSSDASMRRTRCRWRTRVGSLRIKGRRASPGFAAGEVVALSRNAVARAPIGDPAREVLALEAAIRAASSDLGELIRHTEGEESDIIGFQLALLGDAALVEPAMAAIASGTPADHAWSAALDREIADYEAADDEYFRARAGDFKDIRDRVLAHLTGGELTAPRSGAILVADDLPPSRFLSIDWSRGGAILLSGGSASSHVAMLARSHGVPMIVGLGGDVAALTGEVLVDAGAGEVIGAPSEEERRLFEAKRPGSLRVAGEAAALRDKPAVTRDGTAIAVHLNISDPDELVSLDPVVCDGIGLVRTESLSHPRRGPPEKETLFGSPPPSPAGPGANPVPTRPLEAGGKKPIE